MKFCKKCNQEKPLSEFHKQSTTKDGHQAWCKDCARIRDKEYYENNKSKCHEKSRRYKVKMITWIRDIKSSLKCIVCGEDHPSCLDFHHTDPSQKDGSISNLVSRNYSKETVLNEISKCIVLCSNCHRKLHDGAICL